MISAQANKTIRKELKRLTEEARAFSAIYYAMLQFMSEDLRTKIKMEASEFITSNFTKEEIESFYLRNAGRASRTTLEHVVYEILKPNDSK